MKLKEQIIAKEAGNTGLDNTIISMIDELLEKKADEVPQTTFKCNECKAEVIVISDDYKEAIKQRAQLKKELAQMEPIAKPEVPKEPKVEPQAKPPTSQTVKTPESDSNKLSQEELQKKQKRELLKAQIAQAIKENEQAQKQKNETNNQPLNS